MAKKTILDFRKMKEVGEKIAYLVVYDWHNAHFAEEAGMDMLLVGDSVGMSVYGYKSTIRVTMKQMLSHAEAVRDGALNTFIIGDMPFGSYQRSSEWAVINAERFYRKEMDAIKLEGGVRVVPQIKAIVEAGMNVMGHIGLTPQSSGQMGGFKAQGRTFESAMLVIEDAFAVQQAGAFSLLVEAVPSEVTEVVAKMLKIPVLSIGAGPLCDGQLLLYNDLLGLSKVFTPKFVKSYVPQALGTMINRGEFSNLSNISLAGITLQAFKEYVKEVKAGFFPDPENHCYKMLEGELDKFKEKFPGFFENK